jgi:hypothetical protein
LFWWSRDASGICHIMHHICHHPFPWQTYCEVIMCTLHVEYFKATQNMKIWITVANTGTVVDIRKHHHENIESSIPVHTSWFIQFFTMRCLLQTWGFNTKLKRLKWPTTTVDLLEGQKVALTWGFLPSLQ